MVAVLRALIQGSLREISKGSYRSISANIKENIFHEGHLGNRGLINFHVPFLLQAQVWMSTGALGVGVRDPNIHPEILQSLFWGLPRMVPLILRSPYRGDFLRFVVFPAEDFLNLLLPVTCTEPKVHVASPACFLAKTFARLNTLAMSKGLYDICRLIGDYVCKNPPSICTPCDELGGRAKGRTLMDNTWKSLGLA